MKSDRAHMQSLLNCCCQQRLNEVNKCHGEESAAPFFVVVEHIPDYSPSTLLPVHLSHGDNGRNVLLGCCCSRTWLMCVSGVLFAPHVNRRLKDQGTHRAVGRRTTARPSDVSAGL